MAVGAANEEGHVRHAVVAPAPEAAGEGLAVDLLAAAIQRHQHRFFRDHVEQQLAFATDELGGRQLSLFLDLAQDQRPANAAGVVVVEAALGAAAGLADGRDRELHAGVLVRLGRTGLTGLASASSAHIFSRP